MKDNEYSGNVKQFYTPAVESYKALPTEKQYKRDVDDWKRESNRRLKETDSGEVVTSSFWHAFLVIFFILSIIAGLVIAGYFVKGVYDGKFKNTNTQSVSLEPNITVNSDTENTYENTFNNDAQINATIIIENVNIFTNSS